ncbi:MAG: hypothetical protein H6825_08490 [Planctomycetes bacterium]|nr:hypothetical protein [Planctomycetota bacterium]
MTRPSIRPIFGASVAVLLTAVAFPTNATANAPAPSDPLAPLTTHVATQTSTTASAPDTESTSDATSSAADDTSPTDAAAPDPETPTHTDVVHPFAPGARSTADPDAGAAVHFTQRDGDIADVPPYRPWEFAVTPYLWVAGIDGDVKANGTSAGADEGPFSALGDAELGFVANGEVRYGDQGGWVEVFGQQIEDEHSHTGGGAASDTEIEQGYFEAAYAHQIGDDETFDAYGGLRRWHVDTTVDLDGGPSTSQDESWVDPFVGVRKRWRLDDAWGLSARTDVGGFNLGDASDFTAQAMAQAERRIDEHTTWVIGYRVLSVDYDKGSSFEHDVITHGVLTGVTVRF